MHDSVEVNNVPRPGFWENNMPMLKRRQKYVLWYIRKFAQMTGKVVIHVSIMRHGVKFF